MQPYTLMDLSAKLWSWPLDYGIVNDKPLTSEFPFDDASQDLALVHHSWVYLVFFSAQLKNCVVFFSSNSCVVRWRKKSKVSCSRMLITNEEIKLYKDNLDSFTITLDHKNIRHFFSLPEEWRLTNFFIVSKVPPWNFRGIFGGQILNSS